ncbi:hypothetical protein C7974DRAFT_403838 [Boeremia exigua]|uniref:uncharacterized protein n=1 Tax=Boeremia exigua TaxID=749465 RepID=UPI001E8DBA36|nr:uncharacterized protein C7974DRAFT_403838 [Boeremia exigua]KAH6615374.1 hypothetical protein C7974DRAFT_403838 [Boeremia exigua]
MRALLALFVGLLIVAACKTCAALITGRRYCGHRLLDWGFPYDQLRTELRWWNACDSPSGVNEALFRVYETWFGDWMVSLDDPCCMGCNGNRTRTWEDGCLPRVVNATCTFVCD